MSYTYDWVPLYNTIAMAYVLINRTIDGGVDPVRLYLLTVGHATNRNRLHFVLVADQTNQSIRRTGAVTPIDHDRLPRTD